MTQSEDGPSVDPLKLLKTITSVAELTKTTSESDQKVSKINFRFKMIWKYAIWNYKDFMQDRATVSKCN